MQLVGTFFLNITWLYKLFTNKERLLSINISKFLTNKCPNMLFHDIVLLSSYYTIKINKYKVIAKWVCYIWYANPVIFISILHRIYSVYLHCLLLINHRLIWMSLI